jgi:hypothetical protein
MVFPLKIVIFRSYVSLPEGKPNAIPGSAEDDMVFSHWKISYLGNLQGK